MCPHRIPFPKLKAVVMGGPTELAGMLGRIFRGVFPHNPYPALINSAAMVGPVKGIFSAITKITPINRIKAAFKKAAPLPPTVPEAV